MESSPMLCKQGVTGSIPVTSTNFLRSLARRFYQVVLSIVASLGGLSFVC